jgi:hypothetical protein
VRVTQRALGDEGTLEHSVAFGIEAVRGLVSASTGKVAYLDSITTQSWTKRRPRCILGFAHNVVVDKAPPSVLKLPVDWLATNPSI